MKRALMIARISAIVVSGFLASAAFADTPVAQGDGDSVKQDAAASSSDEQFDEFDTQKYEEVYTQANIDRYDALTSSPSPRQQVLAGRIYLEHEEETPPLVRPRRAEAVARAVQLAPDDAFVQWMAADQGSYTSSQCGPTKWPEVEVSNLIGLEPDNVAAWQFAVALASAIGDEAGVDDALSRMASASRADDHAIEQLDEWTTAYSTTPGPEVSWEQGDSDLSNDEKAMLAAFEKIGYSSSNAASVMLGVCKMDVDSDRIWQRLGWCADAAITLASRGSSLALRRQGLALLAAVGASNDEVGDLQRQYDWLNAHNANPWRTYSQDSAGFATAIADWKGAATEIEAIEHRLKRTGQPLQPPSGWAPKAAPKQDEDANAAQHAWLTYTRSLIERLRTSPDARDQAAAASISVIGAMSDEDSAQDAKTLEAANAAKNETLAHLAATNSDNLLVQWIAATTDDSESDRNVAIGQVQKLDPDNGASWALSLAADPGTADLVLPQMAASTRFDDHSSEILALWTDAARKQPPTDDLVKAMAAGADSSSFEDSAYGMVASMLWRSAVKADPVFAVTAACQGKVDAKSPRLESCKTVARLQLNSGTTILTVKTGEQILRHLHAMDESDESRARTIAWWIQVAMPSNTGDGKAISRFLKDMIESGSEIEALRLAAQRAGKAEPPDPSSSSIEKKKAPEKPATSKISDGR